MKDKIKDIIISVEMTTIEPEEAVNKLFDLFVVSQQRELLKFLKWYDLDVEYNSKQTHKQLILSYEQKFNCG